VSGHFGTSAELSYGHFGTDAKVSWVQSVLGPKCLRSEVSWVRSVCTPAYKVQHWTNYNHYLLQILKWPLRVDFQQSRNKYKSNDETLVETSV